MLALAIAILLVSGVLLTLVLKPSKFIYVKALSLPFICLGFIICLVFMSNTVVGAVISGLKLWSGAIIPSLFPFFVSSEIMNSTGFISAAGFFLEPVMRPLFNIPGCGSFPLSMGIVSGYPVGAKITCDYRKAGNLTKTEAERLLAYTSNSGPLFIIGAVGTGMLFSPSLGIFLYLCHFLSSITVGIIFRFYVREKKDKFKMYGTTKGLNCNHILKNRPPLLKNRPPVGIVLGDAVKNATSSVLTVGGFIVLFSVIISILTQLGIIGVLADGLYYILRPLGFNNEFLKGVISAIIEISTGSRLISQVSGISLFQKLSALSLIIGWAGFSVHFQVMSFVASTDLSLRPYFIGKLLHSLLATAYTWVGLKILPSTLLITSPILSSPSPVIKSWLNTFGTATKLAAFLLAVFAVFQLALRLRVIKAANKNSSSI